MKASDLIRQTNRDADDQFSNSDLYDWFNRCLDDLTPLTKKEAQQSYTIDSSNQYTLPTNLHEIVEVVTYKDDVFTPLQAIPQRDYASKGYKVWADKLSVQKGLEEGTVDLYYYRKLARLSGPDDVPEIEEEFQDLLILYALAMSQYMDEEPERQMDAYNRYMARKAEYEHYKSEKAYNVYEIGVV